MSTFAKDVDIRSIDSDALNYAARYQVEFNQWYNLLTDKQLESLRGSQTKDYPATLEYIYQQSEICHQATNAALFANGEGPRAKCDSTTDMNMWPEAFDTGNSAITDPGSLTCHWNIPIVEPQTWSSNCLGNNRDQFIHAGDASGRCRLSFDGFNGYKTCGGIGMFSKPYLSYL